MKDTKFSRSDKTWINGYFEGFEAGEEQALDRLIRLLLRQRRKLRKKKHE